MLQLLAPGSIPGAALIILFEAEVGLGFRHPSPQLCSCSSEPPTPLPPRLSVRSWSLPSDSSDLSQRTAYCLWWTDGIPWVHSCPCLTLLVSPAHVYHLWLKHSHAISGPPQSSLVCDMLEELAHPITDGVTGRTDRLRAQALKSDFLVQILVASYQLCKSSHIFSTSAYRIGTVWELLTTSAYNKRFSNLLFVLGAFLSFWLLRVNNSSSVCLPTAVFTPCLPISSLS